VKDNKKTETQREIKKKRVKVTIGRISIMQREERYVPERREKGALLFP
jgi:hypothetical protein